MVSKRLRSVFIVWKKYQRRVEVLAPYLNLEVYYFHYSWEEKSKLLKVLSYGLKSIATLICLFQKKPALVFVQIPPTPALYCVALYSWLTRARYVSDCHNSMFFDHWSKWVFVNNLLAHGFLIVHNDHIAKHVKKHMGLSSYVLRDGVINIQSYAIKRTRILEDFNLSQNKYVLLPWQFSSDEPLIETFKAATLIPDIKFVMTWYVEKLPNYLQKQIPPNILLTGFLQIDDFNFLFSSAGIALVLTKWENTQLSGMQEAMAFEVPAVVSDLKTTRFLYKDYPIFVRNDPNLIADGVKYAFKNRTELKGRMKLLRDETEKEFSNQIDGLRELLF